MDEEEEFTMQLIYPRLRLYSALTTFAGVVMAVFLWRKKYISFSVFLIISIIFGMIVHFPLWMGTGFLNSMLYRNYHLVEQPIDFDGLTKRLTQEGVDFMEAIKNDETPFLLYMSWLQVHVPLHAGPEFQKASQHGHYGDEVSAYIFNETPVRLNVVVWHGLKNLSCVSPRGLQYSSRKNREAVFISNVQQIHKTWRMYVLKWIIMNT